MRYGALGYVGDGHVNDSNILFYSSLEYYMLNVDMCTDYQ